MKNCPAESLVRRNRRPLLGSSDLNCANLIGLSAILFSGTLSRQSLLHSALRARLQVEGVTLHFFNDVFRLNLALEPTKGILDRLTLLQSNFRQTHPPQTKTNRTYLSLLHLTAPRRTECQTTRWSQCLRKMSTSRFSSTATNWHY
jgi:hypothetical protein